MTNEEADLVASVLADNDLAADVQAFRSMDVPVCYIDRHVLGQNDGVTPPKLRSAACRAALELARSWLQARSSLQSVDMHISVPYVMIDDRWILGAPNSPPPHVIICLARDERALRPANYNVVAVHRESSGHAMVDSLLRNGITAKRLEPDPEFGEANDGSWILELPFHSEDGASSR